MTNLKKEANNWFAAVIRDTIKENNLTISWSKIVYADFNIDKVVEATLKKNYTDYHFINWWNLVSADTYIEYFIGIVMFTDNTWIEFYRNKNNKSEAIYRKFPEFNKFTLNDKYDDLFNDNFIEFLTKKCEE